jgi:hypothetical protein
MASSRQLAMAGICVLPLQSPPIPSPAQSICQPTTGCQYHSTSQTQPTPPSWNFPFPPEATPKEYFMKPIGTTRTQLELLHSMIKRPRPKQLLQHASYVGIAPLLTDTNTSFVSGKADKVTIKPKKVSTEPKTITGEKSSTPVAQAQQK